MPVIAHFLLSASIRPVTDSRPVYPSALSLSRFPLVLATERSVNSAFPGPGLIFGSIFTRTVDYSPVSPATL